MASFILPAPDGQSRPYCADGGRQSRASELPQPPADPRPVCSPEAVLSPTRRTARELKTTPALGPHPRFRFPRSGLGGGGGGGTRTFVQAPLPTGGAGVRPGFQMLLQGLCSPRLAPLCPGSLPTGASAQATCLALPVTLHVRVGSPTAVPGPRPPAPPSFPASGWRPHGGHAVALC